MRVTLTETKDGNAHKARYHLVAEVVNIICFLILSWRDQF